MPQRGSGLGEVEKIANHNIDKDAEVVGVEVLMSGGSGEEEIESF